MVNKVAIKRMLIAAGVVLVLLAIAGGLYKFRKIRIDRQQLSWKTQGIDASHAGDDARAVDLLTRYFKTRCDDPEAVTCYVRSRMRVGHGDAQSMVDSIGAFGLLANLRPLNRDENHQLLDLYLKTNDPRHAVHTADELLASNPADADALKAKTQALMLEGEWAKALAVTKIWAAAQPQGVRSYCDAIDCMQQLGQTGVDIVGYAEKLRVAHPGDARFEFLESRALTLTGQKQAAGESESGDLWTAADFAHAAAGRASADPDLALLLAAQLDWLEQFDESLSVLQKAQAQSTDPGVRLALARREMELGQWDQLASITAAPLSDADEIERVALRALAMEHLGDADELAPLRQSLQAPGAGADAKAWLAVLGDSNSATDSTLLQRVAVYGAALADKPQNAVFRYALADALDQLGEKDLAVAQLRALLLINRTWAVPIARMTSILLDQGHVNAALVAATEYQCRATHNGQLRDVSGAILMARACDAGLDAGILTDDGPTAQLAAAVQKTAPGETQTLLIQLDLLVRANKKDQAIAMMNKTVRNPKTSSGVLLQLAALSQRLGLGLEDQCLDHAAERQPDPTVAYARGAWLFSKGKPAQALALFAAADTATDSITRQIWQLARTKYLELIDDPTAHDQWAMLATSYPDSLAIQRAVLESRAATGDRALTDQTIDRLHKLTGDNGVTWRVCRARWILQQPNRAQADTEQASRLLNSVLRNCPNCVDAHTLLANSLEAMGNIDGAIQHLQAAQSLVPSDLAIALPLAQLEQAHGNAALALQTLHPFTSGAHANVIALFTAGTIQEHQGDLDDAEASYRNALKLQGDFTGAENNLAMVLLKRGQSQDRPEALSLATRAAAASPKSGTVLDTLSLAQITTGDLAGALASIDKAVQLDPANPRLKLRRVEILVLSKRDADAKAALADLDHDLLRAGPSTTTDWDLQNRLRSLHERFATASTTRASGSTDAIGETSNQEH